VGAVTWLQKLGAALGAILLSVLAILGLSAWWRERQRSGELGKSAVDAVDAAVKLEREKAAGEAQAARDKAATDTRASVQAAQDKAAKDKHDADVADTLRRLGG
jgi:hypothetical protein